MYAPKIYKCEICGSLFIPGDKTEGVEVHPQSWPCPMCGACDWQLIDSKLPDGEGKWPLWK